jgi:hypothetical protein
MTPFHLSTVAVLAAVIAVLPAVRGDAAEGPSECPEFDRVQYSETRQLLRDRILIETDIDVGGRFPALRRFEEVRSPHRTAHALLSPPDFKQLGPWTTVVAVKGNQARPLDLLITFRDHGSSAVRARWLNEKLMWFRVWWGRVVATELVLNVETAEPLYMEEADFRLFVVSCEEKQRLIAEQQDETDEPG